MAVKYPSTVPSILSLSVASHRFQDGASFVINHVTLTGLRALGRHVLLELPQPSTIVAGYFLISPLLHHWYHQPHGPRVQLDCSAAAALNPAGPMLCLAFAAGITSFALEAPAAPYCSHWSFSTIDTEGSLNWDIRLAPLQAPIESTALSVP